MDRVSRRQVVGGLGATSIGLIAGCLGDSDDNGDDDDTVVSGDDEDDDDSAPDEEWPTDATRIEIINPYSAGGGFGFFARTFANHLGTYLPNNPTVVSQQMGGGGGLTATNYVWNAEPTGETILLRHGLISKWQQIGLPEDVDYDVRDFVNLSNPSVSYYGLAVSSDLEIETWDDFVELVPEVRWGAAGVGGTSYMFALFLGDWSGEWGPDDMNYVMTDGTSDNLLAIDRGDQEITAGVLASIEEFSEELDGVEPLFSFTEPGAIDWVAPSAEEWGMPAEIAQQAADSFVTPRFFSAPPELPEERAEILADALHAVATDSDVVAAAEEADRELVANGRDEAEEMTANMFENFQQSSDLIEEYTT